MHQASEQQRGHLGAGGLETQLQHAVVLSCYRVRLRRFLGKGSGDRDRRAFVRNACEGWAERSFSAVAALDSFLIRCRDSRDYARIASSCGLPEILGPPMRTIGDLQVRQRPAAVSLL
jgi:hypothetical protein